MSKSIRIVIFSTIIIAIFSTWKIMVNFILIDKIFALSFTSYIVIAVYLFAFGKKQKLNYTKLFDLCIFPIFVGTVLLLISVFLLLNKI